MLCGYLCKTYCLLHRSALSVSWLARDCRVLILFFSRIHFLDPLHVARTKRKCSQYDLEKNDCAKFRKMTTFWSISKWEKVKIQIAFFWQGNPKIDQFLLRNADGSAWEHTPMHASTTIWPKSRSQFWLQIMTYVHNVLFDIGICYHHWPFDY